MCDHKIKRQRVYGSNGFAQKCFKRTKGSNKNQELSGDEVSKSSAESSELSDIEGDALQLNSDIMQGLEQNESDSLSSESEQEDKKELESIITPQKSISLMQSVNFEEIEHTKKESIDQDQHDGRKLLEEAETSLVIDDSQDGLHSGSHLQEELIDSKEQYLQKLEIRRSYIHRYDLPPVLTSQDLIVKIQPLLPIVRDMYKGVVDSYYKYEATLVSKRSCGAILSLKEFRSININRFLAGFYGFKRQMRVGEEILRHFKPFLLRRQGETMLWWGLDDFANYILAPEVLASLCILEMNWGSNLYDKETRERAYELFDKTTEFGLKVADFDPLEDWEIQVQKERVAEFEQDSTIGTASNYSGGEHD